MYDVLLEKVSNGTISFEVEDLSPVGVAKITVSEAPVLVVDAQNDSEVSTIDNSQIQKANKGKVVALVLLIIALVLGGGTFLLLKLSRDGKVKLPKFST